MERTAEQVQQELRDAERVCSELENELDAMTPDPETPEEAHMRGQLETIDALNELLVMAVRSDRELAGYYLRKARVGDAAAARLERVLLQV